MSQFEWLEIGYHMTRDMCPIVSFCVTSFIVRKGQKKQYMSNCSHKESNEIKANSTFLYYKKYTFETRDNLEIYIIIIYIQNFSMDN